MKNTCGFLSLLLLLLTAVCAHAQSDTLTPEEQNAVTSIREHFNERLDKEGSLKPLISEMFVAEFGARYAKEKKADVTEGELILLCSGLQFKKAVLDTATADDWQHARIATFDFMHTMMVPMLNQMVPALKSGKEPDAEKLDSDINALFPHAVTDLFDKDPILKNFIQLKQDSRPQPIASAEELRRVSDLIDKGRGMMEANTPAKDKHLSPAAAAAMTSIMSDKEFGPWLQIADRETYGFPKGTRLIYLFATPMYALTIVKVGNEYKIASADIASPD